jgi:hypothetical protein
MSKAPKFVSVPSTGSSSMPPGNAVSELGGASLARRRYQHGTLILKNGEWIGRWRIDEIRDGQITRRRVYELLGTMEQLATRSLAKRALQQRIALVNDVGYRAKTVARFRDFAKRWVETVMIQHNQAPAPHSIRT